MSFLRDYMDYAKGNEAHPNYHLWCALSALSAIVSRKVWVEMGYFNIYANLYVVLVGPPAQKKTTAMSICKGLLRELKDIPFSAEAQTKESLTKDMKEQARVLEWGGKKEVYTPYTVCVTELSHFLGPQNGHMVDFLTTVFDAPFYDVKTKNKGTDVIEGPYLSLLGCTTPAWISARLRDDVISGGFSRRALFIYEDDEPKKITFPEVTDEMKTSWERVVSAAKEIRKMRGPFKWDGDARKFFDEWYQKSVLPKNPMTQGYHRSKNMQALKVAQLVAASETRETVLLKPHIQAALGVLEQMEKNLERVFECVGRNELASVGSKLKSMLGGGPVLERVVFKELLRDANMDELTRVVATLVHTQEIVRFKEAEDSKDVYLRLKAVV